VIRFSNVNKAYPNGAMALKDVSFHVSKGEFVFLTGHSGAGKSTIMKVLFAEQRPSAGEVRVSGYNVTTIRPDDVPRLRRRLGVVFQDFRLLEDRTAAENIAFALEVTGARTDTIAARVMRVLTQVGLSAKSRAYPRELSGGEQQRVAIAVALANEPEVILADEPTGELDSGSAAEIFELLRRLNRELGVTIVVATHDPLVSSQVSRTVSIRDGRVSSEVLRHRAGPSEEDHHIETEFAVLDRVGRLQLPRAHVEALGLEKRVRVDLEEDHLSVWPDRSDGARGGPPPPPADRGDA
jgi:cell division ATP-binding protein FtsE